MSPPFGGLVCGKTLKITGPILGEGYSLTPDELDQARELGCKVFHKPYDLDEISDWLNQQESFIVSPENETRV